MSSNRISYLLSGLLVLVLLGACSPKPVATAEATAVLERDRQLKFDPADTTWTAKVRSRMLNGPSS
jgi:hypothetical protein